MNTPPNQNVVAVIGAVKIMSGCFGEAYSPPRITARRGGCAINRMLRSYLSSAQTGWCSFLFPIGKPPRPRYQRRLRNIFLSARPPLLAVMQGGEYASPKHSGIFFHSRLDRAYSH